MRRAALGARYADSWSFLAIFWGLVEPKSRREVSIQLTRPIKIAIIPPFEEAFVWLIAIGQSRALGSRLNTPLAFARA
jgi:hypothetical protein